MLHHPGILLSALLGDKEVAPEAKAVRLAVEEFRPQSIYELAKKMKLSRMTAGKICRKLAACGWLALAGSDHRLQPIPLIPDSCQQQMIQALQAAYDAAPHKQEFLMKCLLDLWVASDQYMDNARPPILRNPKTGAYMEYDRWYFDGYAYEYNGTQHYRPTKNYPDETQLAKQKERDSMKKDFSKQGDVHLVVVTQYDLEPATFGYLIPDGQPKAHVQLDSLYCQELTRLCRLNRAKSDAE